jgi:hypothetical protein
VSADDLLDYEDEHNEALNPKEPTYRTPNDEPKTLKAAQEELESLRRLIFLLETKLSETSRRFTEFKNAGNRRMQEYISKLAEYKRSGVFTEDEKRELWERAVADTHKANQAQFTQKDSRIAELEARVAELQRASEHRYNRPRFHGPPQSAPEPVRSVEPAAPTVPYRP